MSIIIKGMEMPKDCNNCKFFNDNYDYPTCSVTDHSRGYNWNPRGQRMPDCPLVEVPKHGRLIDADELCEALIKRWNTADKNAERIISEVMADVVTPIVTRAPTIIEAEE